MDNFALCGIFMFKCMNQIILSRRTFGHSVRQVFPNFDIIRLPGVRCHLFTFQPTTIVTIPCILLVNQEVCSKNQKDQNGAKVEEESLSTVLKTLASSFKILLLDKCESVTENDLSECNLLKIQTLMIEEPFCLS